MNEMVPDNVAEKENKKKISYAIGFVVAVIFLYLTITNLDYMKPEIEYRYVCPDGNIVKRASSCSLPEPQVIIRKINSSCNESIEYVGNHTLSIYVCENGSVVSNISECVTTTSTTSTTTTTREFNPECVKLGCPRGTEYVGSKKRGQYYGCKCYISRYMINETDRLCFESIQAAESFIYDGNKTLEPCKICLEDF
ncbi:MAG: hypothetical protein U9M95_06435 [Candidatus Altiarchaeota archaeon]|nr:hypothetical protein [Candidatus Altiarchaeota archaeon]